MTEATNRRVLLVDDNRAIHEDFRKIFDGLAPRKSDVAGAKAAFFGAVAQAEPEGVAFEVESAHLGQEALEKVEQATRAKRPFALAFMDVRMPPGWDGIETVSRLWQVDPDLQVVICTAYSDYTWQGMVKKLGRTDRLLLLKKPFDPVEVCQIAIALTEKWNATARERLRIDEVKRAESEARAYAASLVTVNRALEAAKAGAEAAARAKSEFLANTSHEIRTPMIAILGSAELLRDPALGPSGRQENVETIRTHGRHLLAILDDILDIACIETGRMAIESRPCSPLEIVEEVLARVRELATAKGLSISAACEGPVPRVLRSDPVRLRQVLQNLVGNAVKFTDRGSVVIRTSLCPPEPGMTPRLSIAVADTGIGIPREAIGRLFEAFTQVDASATRAHGGAGLGLALAKRLCQMIGGDLAVLSAPGQGSTFTVTLPIGELVDAASIDAPAGAIPSASTTPALRCAAPVEASGIAGRILLVEDAPVTQRLHAQFLRRAGADVATAENGQAAVELARESAAQGRPFDLVLMDMQMPLMDGYEATRRLRAEGWRRPIIAVTAHVTSADREKCLAAGCDDHIPKPVEREAFVEACRELLARIAPRPPLPSAPQVAPSDSTRSA